MKNTVFLTVALLTIFLSGCAGSMPQTAAEFRKALPGSFMGKVETFEVNRPFKDVAKIFQTMAPKCLDVRLKTISDTYQSHQVIVAKYTPTVIVTKHKAELHVQERHEAGVIAVYKEPEKGHFLMVVDAIPLNKDRTQITMYRPSKGHDVMVKAIKGWATGKNVGCPDFTK
jgi:predicted component of type VI protein secretion system